MDRSTAAAVTVDSAAPPEPLWACTFWVNLVMYWLVVVLLISGLSKLNAMMVSANANPDSGMRLE